MKRRRIKLLALTAIVVLGGLVWAAGVVSEGDESRGQPVGNRASGNETPFSRLEAEHEMIRLAVAGHDGKLVEARNAEDGWTIGIEAKAETPDLAKLVDKAHAIFTELARTRIQVARATVLFRTDALKDVYGHRLKDVALARIALEGETFRKINWAGFSPHNFPRVADELWVHDILVPQIQQLSAGGGPGRPQEGSQGGSQESEGEKPSESAEKSGGS